MAKKKSKSLNTKKTASELKKSKVNPFELLNAKKGKFTVLNSNLKSKRRNLVAIRSRLLKKRYKTILTDHQKISKSNTFNDNRFGENSKLTLDEINFQRLKRTRLKKDRYNLGKKKPVELIQSNSENLVKKTFEDEDNNDFDADDFVRKLYAAEFNKSIANKQDNLADKRRRSRDEILKEVMMKAKLYKAERQKDKVELETLTEDNDANFQKLFSVSNSLNLKPSKTVSLNDMTEQQKSYIEKETLASTRNIRGSFSSLVKELQTSAKVKATDKSWTADEVAKRERKMLEQLQKEHDKRKLEDLNSTIKSSESKRQKIEKLDEYGNSIKNDLFGDSGLSNDMKESTVNKDLEQTSSTVQESILSDIENQLPYIIEIDENFSHTDLVKLLFMYSSDSDACFKLCDRIRKVNSIHLKKENKIILERFFNVLLDHYFLLSSLPSGSKVRKNLNSPISIVVAELIKLSQDLKDEVCITFIKILKKMYTNLDESIKIIGNVKEQGGDYGVNSLEDGMPHHFYKKRKLGGHKGQAGKKKIMEYETDEKHVCEFLYGADSVKITSAACWPTTAEIAFLKLLFLIFPVSDHRHNISGSAILLISKYLLKCPFRGPRDVCVSLSLCALIVEAMELLKRQKIHYNACFIPEVLLLLEAALGQVSLGSQTKLSQLTRRQTPIKLADLHNASSGNEFTLPFKNILQKRKLQESQNILDLLREPFISQNISRVCPSTFDRYLSEICISLLKFDFPHKNLFTDKVSKYLSRLKRRARYKDAYAFAKNLQTDKQTLLLDIKDSGINVLKPRFSVEHYGREKMTPRVAMKKLQQQVKKEKKNLLKEIRRDSALLANSKERTRMKQLKREKEKLKQNMQFLEDMNRNINNAVKSGERLAGGGTRNIDMKGRRRR